MQDSKTQMPHFELTESILGCCFDVMNELGVAFLESVYKNALTIAMKEKGLSVQIEKGFEVAFRGRKIGMYKADLIINERVIVELKCCEQIHNEHLVLGQAFCEEFGRLKALTKGLTEH